MIQQATVEQDPETGDLLCVLTPESALSLEDSQLLTGNPIFDSSGTAHLRERLTELASSVLDPEILAFLKEWAGRAATASVEVGDDTAILPLPRLHPAPALVLRKRGAFALLEYYDRMIRASERADEPVPLGIAQLVEAIEPEDRLTWLERTAPPPRPTWPPTRSSRCPPTRSRARSSPGSAATAVSWSRARRAPARPTRSPI